MKLSVAIADDHALPSAFVVFRGIEKSIVTAKSLGFDGVELAMKRPDEINTQVISELLAEQGMEISCISTGQVYADLGYSFSDADSRRRETLITMFREFVDLGSHFGVPVNIGRVRGPIGDRDKDEVESLFVDSMKTIGSYARDRNVDILIEPVNRYEIDFINSVEQGAQVIEKIGLSNMLLMPDVFHMNIEDTTIEGELATYRDKVGYIHFADSNRLAPGWGHLDFMSILKGINAMGYDGWISAEIFPIPDPYTAAKQAANYLLSLMNALHLRENR